MDLCMLEHSSMTHWHNGFDDIMILYRLIKPSWESVLVHLRVVII